jgi:hypothetical protein
VSVKINVVMAADSASSFASGMIYHHAQKIVNLRKGRPIGAIVTGAGGIGNESIDTLLKDLRRRFSGGSADHPDWSLDPGSHTVEQVSVRVREFLFEEKARPLGWQRLNQGAPLRLLRRPSSGGGLGSAANGA